MNNTISKKIHFLALLLGCIVYMHAGEASTDFTAEFNITSRTSFGVDLDLSYRYGLHQELADFNFILHLTPYQKLTNRVNSTGPVGFINLTFFNLDLMSDESLGYNAGVPDQKAYLMRNRFQTGEFLAGIAFSDWIIQLNAGANEPFWDPWNKGIQFTNDKVKFSWAYLDSMIDVKRIKKITELSPQDPVVTQFQQDACGPTDQFGLNITGATIAAHYNKEDVFGLNLKFATEYPYDSEAITENNSNGIAAGFDVVVTPPAIEGLKIFASAGGSVNYGKDENPDPFVFGTRVGYTIPLNEDITIEPYGGFDGGMKFSEQGSNPFEFEASCGLTMRWPGQAGWFTDYILNKDGRVFPGMSIAYSAFGNTDALSDINHSLKFTLFEPRGDDGVFYKIGSEMVVDVTHLGQKNWDMLATLYFDYEVPGFLKTNGRLIPWLTLCYDNLPFNAGEERENALKTDLGVKLDGVISNTVIGLVWNSGNLISEKSDISYGFIKTFVEIKF